VCEMLSSPGGRRGGRASFTWGIWVRSGWSRRHRLAHCAVCHPSAATKKRPDSTLPRGAEDDFASN